MIIRSGFDVYSAEVEAVLNAHKDVVQSAVVGRPVEGNEEVVAFVQLIRGSKTGAADLADFLERQLAAYNRPSEIILLDALPATSTGKILKHQRSTRRASAVQEGDRLVQGKRNRGRDRRR